MTKASRNARCTSSGVPWTAAGSGMPQCAVIGWPGQTGHTSLAALSHTVNTKSSSGAPGCANSSQVLLRDISRRKLRRFELPECLRPHLARWVAARAVGREARPASVVQDGFRHDRARRIAGAQKKHVVVVLASCPPPELGAAGRTATGSVRTTGLTARTKALMNLPSTSAAIASTSTPSAVRHVARILGSIDARGLDVDLLEAGGRKLASILNLFERAGHAADPKQNALADFES